MARPRSAEARMKALEAAVQVLADEGVSGFTVEAVARRSGVAKTTIYRNWSSVDELLFDALDLMIEPEPEPDTGSLRGDLLSLADHLVSISEDERHARRQVFSGLFAASVGDRRLAEVFDRMVTSRCVPVQSIVAKAQARDELNDRVDIRLVTELLIGPVLFRLMFRDETFSRPELENLVDYGLEGLLRAS
ncbi:MAG: TetR/AcrR family transcriptional regulator [Acidimicrobiia bacterium]|nr:TetR/AcrR family transcriptional regulator [Acidimicrobiia bacterium]